MQLSLHYLPHAIIAALGSVGIYLLKKGADAVFDSVKSAIRNIIEFAEQLREDLNHIKNIQGVQAENHLTTIQSESIKTNELLNDMRTQNAETNGYLKAIVDKK
jgi:competence protein ComGF